MDQHVTRLELHLPYVTHAALPHLVRAAAVSHRKVADVVYISSTAGRVARPGGSAYSLTKFGIAAFAESLRQELIAKGVRVSVVEPGAAPQSSSPISAKACARLHKARSNRSRHCYPRS